LLYSVNAAEVIKIKVVKFFKATRYIHIF